MKHLPTLSRRVRLLLDLVLLLALAAFWAILAQPSFTPEMAMERAQTYYHFGPGTILRSGQVPPPTETDLQFLPFSFDGESHYFLLQDQGWQALILCQSDGLLWDWQWYRPAFWQPDPEAAVSCVETGGFLAGTVQDPRAARITVHYDLTYRAVDNGPLLQLPRSAETRDLEQGAFCLTLQRSSYMESLTVQAYDAAGSLLWEGVPVSTGTHGIL